MFWVEKTSNLFRELSNNLRSAYSTYIDVANDAPIEVDKIPFLTTVIDIDATIISFNNLWRKIREQSSCKFMGVESTILYENKSKIDTYFQKVGDYRLWEDSETLKTLFDLYKIRLAFINLNNVLLKVRELLDNTKSDDLKSDYSFIMNKLDLIYKLESCVDYRTDGTKKIVEVYNRWANVVLANIKVSLTEGQSFKSELIGLMVSIDRKSTFTKILSIFYENKSNKLSAISKKYQKEAKEAYFYEHLLTIMGQFLNECIKHTSVEGLGQLLKENLVSKKFLNELIHILPALNVANVLRNIVPAEIATPKKSQTRKRKQSSEELVKCLQYSGKFYQSSDELVENLENQGRRLISSKDFQQLNALADFLDDKLEGMGAFSLVTYHIAYTALLDNNEDKPSEVFSLIM